MNRYTDWIMPYLQKQSEDARKYSGNGTEDKLKTIAKVYSMFE